MVGNTSETTSHYQNRDANSTFKIYDGTIRDSNVTKMQTNDRDRLTMMVDETVDSELYPGQNDDSVSMAVREYGE